MLVSCPQYLKRRDVPGACTKQKPPEALEGGRTWLHSYLDLHVLPIQEHKQHHIHKPPDKNGVRLPLTHCARKDKPALCKGEFPRVGWLIDTAVVLCQGLIKKWA